MDTLGFWLTTWVPSSNCAAAIGVDHDASFVMVSCAVLDRYPGFSGDSLMSCWLDRLVYFECAALPIET